MVTGLGVGRFVSNGFMVKIRTISQTTKIQVGNFACRFGVVQLITGRPI